MSKELIAANFEVKRFQMMEAFKRDPSSISAPLVFAYDKRIAPIDHNHGMIESYGFDPFDSVYNVDNDMMKKIAKHLDTMWDAGDPEALKFSSLEDKFGGYKTMRMELVYAITYFKLNDLFGDDLYKAVMIMAPSEASGIMRPYRPEDVYLD
ncbi:hypothetical protein HFO45_17010 [Rhizobium leguminosarum]|jgi:hypothetical protein|uniref:hypothetical protein n=1 Tax=Rhizobium TaxID=379 RepID=UPI00102FA249|nr:MULTISPECIES: hypothetical protein [Rhizobium]MBY5649947.1 hypothetical protein [Rhizobium leguminosarum]TAV00336.1 hypothetical protein ELI39_31040 [Rhizobium ruizarguesonis]